MDEATTTVTGQGTPTSQVERGAFDAPARDTVDTGTAPDEDFDEARFDRRARLRHQLVPVPVAGLLWGAAKTAHATAPLWPYSTATATGVYFVAAVVWWWRWSGQHPQNRAARRRWVTTVVACGGGWLLWAATAGPGQVLTTLLTVGGTLLMLPYWARASAWQPNDYQTDTDETDDDIDTDDVEPDDDPEPVPPVEPVDTRTATQMHWDLMVACPGGALPGSQLILLEDSGDVETYLIQLVAGHHTTDTATAALLRIASAYGRGTHTVQVTPYPTGDQDKALFRLSKANPLRQVHEFPGVDVVLDISDGNIRAIIGYGNATPVYWEFYLAGWGSKGGAVFGDTGTGKSELLRVLITVAAYCPLLTPIVACPQGGASFPMWMRHGHWPAATAEEILEQARGLAAAHMMRSHINRLNHRDIHVPTPEAPGIVWVIDEIHKMMENKAQADEFFGILDMIEREGRKTAIRAIVGDQDPSALKTFNGMATLRRSLIGAGGQCVTLRLSSNVDVMLPGMKIDPTKLATQFEDGSPAVGLAVRLGDAEPYRNFRIANAAELAAAAPISVIEQAVASQMGRSYTDRFIRALAADADAYLAIRDHDPAVAATLLDANPHLSDAIADALRRRDEADRAAAKAAGGPAALPAAPARKELCAPTPPTFAMPAPPVWTCKERALAVLRSGVTKFGDLMAQATKPDGTQYSETAMREALSELIGDGLARRARDDNGLTLHGHYEAISTAA